MLEMKYKYHHHKRQFNQAYEVISNDDPKEGLFLKYQRKPALQKVGHD
jgi:hypothetical protein